ncbi:uncharacterized protein BKA55DRAFT_684323 [Fusarium redolens]|uniref:RNase H type-1 domain-containing protein n=1 Tax=Fusarium redolens TaxID=48865 RepID=A0A9P9KR90_FUSRE|nr:uncharacterized protein BKA55DRAFT_684323 [Fusarium redolens]KAH7267059.1 hypothetical protein BKA55DRAFT_684323 [Fusarium redolens]
MPELQEDKDMLEELEDDALSPFQFTDDYFSDNIADEDGSAREPARTGKRLQNKRSAAKKAARKEKMEAIEEERRILGPLHKSLKKACKQYDKKERQIRLGAKVTLADIDMETFAGAVVSLKGKCQANCLAATSCRDEGLNVLALWADGSITNIANGGAAVVFMDKSLGREETIWKEIGWQVKGHNAHIGDVEAMAIAGALETAIFIVSQQSTSRIRKVAIFSDSTEAISRCSEIWYFPIPPLDSLVRRRSHELARLGVALSLIWVPAHSGVEGNYRAHAIAKSMGKLDCPDLCQSTVSIPRSMDDVVDFGFHRE